ncbi:hypothetical protein HQN90_05885 [Paenibacillus alba]|uniref:hypothetical protein n=1 Tax=Paenibacillus alba TaxID=1197127 RepID=UPI001564896A|nr:hypothetical protein [Paenibacillus alba]NQX65654.1 hypothetical protein [Paenibacillus alba]
MEIFPEEHELINIFECEPQVTLEELDVPDYYKQWRFILKRETDVLEFDIEPSISYVYMRWHQENKVILELALEEVYGIEIKKQGNSEFILLLFQDERFKTLTLRTKPYISVVWGTAKI